MKVIKTYSGKEIFVDDEDFDKVSKYKWQISRTNKNISYALRHATVDGKKTKVYLHRELFGFPDGMIDHIDRNGLNCQKYNLRIVDRTDNASNSGPIGSIPFKGVSRHKDVYRMQFFHRGLSIRKTYATAEEAALKYNELAILYKGEYAFLNVIK